MPITVNNNAPVQNQYIAEIMHIRAALDEALQQPGVPQATAAQIQQHMNAAEQEAKKEKTVTGDDPQKPRWRKGAH